MAVPIIKKNYKDKALNCWNQLMSPYKIVKIILKKWCIMRMLRGIYVYVGSASHKPNELSCHNVLLQGNSVLASCLSVLLKYWTSVNFFSGRAAVHIPSDILLIYTQMCSHI